jgi:hypothetical protein
MLCKQGQNVNRDVGSFGTFYLADVLPTNACEVGEPLLRQASFQPSRSQIFCQRVTQRWRYRRRRGTGAFRSHAWFNDPHWRANSIAYPGRDWE